MDNPTPSTGQQDATPGPPPSCRPGRWAKRIGILMLLLFTGPLLVVSCGSVRLGGDWRTADRSPTGIAPDPMVNREAVVQVYAARAFNWRGIFAVHTWIATKEKDARHYTVYQVVGWRSWRGLPVVVSGIDVPDRAWFGNPPEIIADHRGQEASLLIPQIRAAVASYPYAERYTTWPGPNSNTFTAHVARAVPALGLELPTTAIGKDYLNNGQITGPAPSGTGYQVSLFGLLGVTAARKEGVEFNVLGLAFGLDPENLAIKLPGIGNVGLR